MKLRPQTPPSLSDQRKADLERWLARTADVVDAQAELAGRLGAFEATERVETLIGFGRRVRTAIRARRMVGGGLALVSVASIIAWLEGVSWAWWVGVLCLYVAGAVMQEGKRWRNLLCAVPVTVGAAPGASLSSLLALLELVGTPLSGVSSSVGRVDRHRLAVAAVREALVARLSRLRADEALGAEDRNRLLAALRSAAAEYGGLNGDPQDLSAFLVAGLLVLGDQRVDAVLPTARTLEMIARSARLRAAAQECARALNAPLAAR